MRKIFKNKKGDEKILSIYLFIIYGIVASGLISGVYLFYNGVDIREVEANLLNKKVVDCIVEQGELKNEIFEEEFDLRNFCNLDFKDNTEKFSGSEEFFVQMNLLDMNSNFLIKKEFGNLDFAEYCDLNTEGVVCLRQRVYILENKEQRILEVISGVRKK